MKLCYIICIGDLQNRKTHILNFLVHKKNIWLDLKFGSDILCNNNLWSLISYRLYFKITSFLPMVRDSFRSLKWWSWRSGFFLYFVLWVLIFHSISVIHNKIVLRLVLLVWMFVWSLSIFFWCRRHLFLSRLEHIW